MRKNYVVCGFPGIGKTHCFRSGFLPEGFTLIDLDSSWFSKEDFPENYITALLKDQNPNVKTVHAISTHPEVIKALIDRGIKPAIVVPTMSQKMAYLKRYKNRGSSDLFINHLDRNWSLYLSGLNILARDNNLQLFELAENEYLTPHYLESRVIPALKSQDEKEIPVDIKPENSEEVLEEKLEEKGLTGGIRLTPADIDALIGENAKIAYYHPPETRMVICTITLETGYTLTGESSCLDPQNFDLEIAKGISFKNAREKLWALEAYHLRKINFDVAGAVSQEILDLVYKAVEKAIDDRDLYKPNYTSGFVHIPSPLTPSYPNLGVSPFPSGAVPLRNDGSVAYATQITGVDTPTEE